MSEINYMKSTHSHLSITNLDSIWINFTITGVKIFFKILVTVLKDKCKFPLTMQHIMQSAMIAN